MFTVTWDPDHRKPADAGSIEHAIRGAAPGARVKLTWVGEAWRVRALSPAALCGRGTDTAGRDASATVAAVLDDHGYPAVV